jgi:hypothetical protein
MSVSTGDRPPREQLRERDPLLPAEGIEDRRFDGERRRDHPGERAAELFDEGAVLLDRSALDDLRGRLCGHERRLPRLTSNGCQRRPLTVSRHARLGLHGDEDVRRLVLDAERDFERLRQREVEPFSGEVGNSAH